MTSLMENPDFDYSTSSTSHLGANTIYITNAAKPVFTGRTTMLTADGIYDPAEQAIDGIKYLAAHYRHAAGETGDDDAPGDATGEPADTPDGEPATGDAPADVAAAPGLVDDEPADGREQPGDDPDEAPARVDPGPDTVDA